MDGDMNDIFQKLNGMLSDEETRSNLKNILNNISSSNNSSDKVDSESQSTNTESVKDARDNVNTSSNNSNKTNNLDFDLQTFLKLQSVLKNINNESNDSRSRLLLSLKPYLRESKKEKLDQYIKMLNLAKIIEVMGPLGGENKKSE